MKIQTQVTIGIFIIALGILFFPVNRAFNQPSFHQIDENEEQQILKLANDPLLFDQVVIHNTGIITITSQQKTEVFSGSVIIDTTGGVSSVDIDHEPFYTIDDLIPANRAQSDDFLLIDGATPVIVIGGK